MTLKLVVDRFEEDFCIALDFEDKRYLIPKNLIGDMKVNDIFNIEFDGESFSNPILLSKETEQRKSDVSKRMKKLFKTCKRQRGI